MKTLYRNTLISLIILIVTSIVLLFIYSFKINFFPESSIENSTISWLESSDEIASKDLLSPSLDWKIYTNKLISCYSPYTYGKVVIENKTYENKNLYIVNTSTNIKTDLYKQIDNDLVHVGRFGLSYPTEITEHGQAPIKITKAAFNVRIEPLTTNTYFIEYSQSDYQSFSPRVLTERDFLTSINKENKFLTVIYILLGFICFTIFLQGVLLKNNFLKSYAFFIFAQTLNYIRVTRFSFLLFSIPIPYYSFEICLTLIYISSFFIVITIMDEKEIRKSYSLYIIVVGILLCIIATILFICGVDINTQSILNGIGLVILITVVIEIFKKIRKGKEALLFLVLILLPWILFSIIDMYTAMGLFDTKHSSVYSVELAFLVSQSIFVVFWTVIEKIEDEKQQTKIISYFTSTEIPSAKDLFKMNSIQGSSIRIIFEKILQPLEIIKTSACMLQTSQSLTKTVSLSQIILDTVYEIKMKLGIDFGGIISDQELSQNSFSEIIEQNNFSSSMEIKCNKTICVFGSKTNSNISLMMLIQSEGFQCVIIEAEEKLMRGIEEKTIDLLVLDSAALGESALTVCKTVRNKFDILDFPILFVVNYFANYFLQKGYSIGINDYIARPFDSAELFLRISSMLRITSLVNENKILAKSEMEKRTFLYFVTHNVNTPLTLLENRVCELSETISKDKKIPDELMVKDIKESVYEINSIIKNVLISFRISDGRYINKQTSIDISNIFMQLQEQMKMKASYKQIKILWNIENKFSIISCNENALIGILSNLIDNAIKFSPIKEKIKVEAHVDNQIKYISVIDNGPGISAEKQKIVFSKFEDRGVISKDNRQSVGLGLYVAFELAKLNNISLSYKNVSENKGSCFILKI